MNEEWFKKFRARITFLYVIGREDGPVKIGISNKPEKRLTSIQNGCPFPIQVLHSRKLYSRDNARKSEQFFHKTNASYRLKGEWFDMPAEAAIRTIEASFEEWDRRRRAYGDEG